MPKSKINDRENNDDDDDDDDDEFNLDSLLSEITFGKYQMFIFGLIAFPIALNGIFNSSYIFTAGNLNYRCHKMVNICVYYHDFLSIFIVFLQM